MSRPAVPSSWVVYLWTSRECDMQRAVSYRADTLAEALQKARDGWPAEDGEGPAPSRVAVEARKQSGRTMMLLAEDWPGHEELRSICSDVERRGLISWRACHGIDQTRSRLVRQEIAQAHRRVMSRSGWAEAREPWQVWLRAGDGGMALMARGASCAEACRAAVALWRSRPGRHTPKSVEVLYGFRDRRVLRVHEGVFPSWDELPGFAERLDAEGMLRWRRKLGLDQVSRLHKASERRQQKAAQDEAVEAMIREKAGQP